MGFEPILTTEFRGVVDSTLAIRARGSWFEPYPCLIIFLFFDFQNPKGSQRGEVSLIEVNQKSMKSSVIAWVGAKKGWALNMSGL